jgi:hypothetical protein
MTIDKEPFFRKVEAVLSMAPNSLTGTQEIRFNEWDSVAVLGMLALCDRAGGKLSPKELARCQTADDLFVAVVRSAGG